MSNSLPAQLSVRTFSQLRARQADSAGPDWTGHISTAAVYFQDPTKVQKLLCLKK